MLTGLGERIRAEVNASDSAEGVGEHPSNGVRSRWHRFCCESGLHRGPNLPMAAVAACVPVAPLVLEQVAHHTRDSSHRLPTDSRASPCFGRLWLGLIDLPRRPVVGAVRHPATQPGAPELRRPAQPSGGEGSPPRWLRRETGARSLRAAPHPLGELAGVVRAGHRSPHFRSACRSSRTSVSPALPAVLSSAGVWGHHCQRSSDGWRDGKFGAGRIKRKCRSGARRADCMGICSRAPIRDSSEHPSDDGPWPGQCDGGGCPPVRDGPSVTGRGCVRTRRQTLVARMSLSAETGTRLEGFSGCRARRGVWQRRPRVRRFGRIRRPGIPRGCWGRSSGAGPAPWRRPPRCAR